MNLSCLPYVLHAPPIDLITWIIFFEKKNHEVPHYEVFSSRLLPPPLLLNAVTQISPLTRRPKLHTTAQSGAPCSTNETRWQLASRNSWHGHEFRDFGLPPRNAKNCNLLSHYAASSGDSLPTFRHNLSVPSSGLNNSPQMRGSRVFTSQTLITLIT
jgi:hypothetical protein